MQLNPTIHAALEQVAWRYNVPVDALHAAIARESATELAQVLGIARPVAETHMARLQRAVTIQSDLGAGCKLLTDDVEADVLAALTEL